MNPKNNFKIIFQNKEKQVFDVDYTLNDTVVADKWFNKIKHLRFVPIDKTESEQVDLSNIKQIYLDFCKFAELEPIELEQIDQDVLNQLHKIYETSHQHVSKKKNNDILYKFHHAVHYHETNDHVQTKINVGWGVKEGLLTENFLCNSHYEPTIKANNIYLSWAELGKRPMDYWKDKEPNSKTRFEELAKPHITLRAKFFIAQNDIMPKKLEDTFLKWFDPYKESWLNKYNLNKWDEIDEHSAPLLATTVQTMELDHCKFVKIVS